MKYPRSFRSVLLSALCLWTSGDGLFGQGFTEGFNESVTNVSLTGGGYFTGSSATGDRPASTPFAFEGTHSFGVTNSTATILSNPINSTVGTGMSVSFKLASFSIGSTGNGADGSDTVVVAVSPDGGTNWFNTVTVAGNGNAHWSFTSGTGVATAAYDGDSNTVLFAPTSGGARTTDGYSTVEVTNLPQSANLRFRITLLNNATSERWLVDELKFQGTFGTPTITSPASAETATFTTTYGVASNVQTFAVAGTDLSGPITATAPAGFQVSNDGTVWGATAVFEPTAGAVTGATLRVRLAPTAPVAGSYNGVVIALTTPGATGVNLTTPATGSSVSAAVLTITANDVTKPFGQVLSAVNAGSTAFVPSGLVNDETVATVTMTYTDGFAALATAGVYVDAVVPSAAVGGSFDIGNYSVTYVPGDLTVSADPVVTLTGTLTAMSTVYGTASVAQTASVSGAGLTTHLLVSAPPEYEVSLAESSGYADTLTLTPVANAVAATTIYLRIKANSPAGVVAAGLLSVASAGATTQTLTVLVGNVDTKVLTIQGLVAEDKEYDRTTAASLIGTATLEGVVAGDEADAVLSGVGEAAFGQFTPGTGLNVTVTGFSLAGSKKDNYTLAPLVLMADITAKELTLAGAAVVTRASNGTTAATITGTLSGVIDPDVVGFTGAGSFDNVGPGAPIPVTANIVLTGANAGNYTLLQPTGLTGRINGGGAGSVITRWTFEGDSVLPAVGSGTASLIGGTAATFAAGSGGGRAWNLNTFPAVGANSGTAGAEFAVSTAGSSGITMTFEHRGSGTSSRWARVDYSLDGGGTWVTNFWNNHDEANGGRATGIAPDSSFYLFTVNFSGVLGADNNPLFRTRIVSVFSPVEFTANSLPYAADAAYRPSGTSGTASYGTNGTWRFDNVTFTGNPPFQFLGSTPNHLAPEVAPDSTIQLTFTKPATLTGTAVTLVDGASNPIPFTGLPVTEGQSVVTLTPASRLPYGEQITLTLVRDQITSGAETLDSTTTTIPVVFTTEVAVTPVVEVTPAALEVPINTTAILTANVTAGSAPVTLQWYEGDASNLGAAALLTGQIGATLEVTNPTVGARSFFVRATSAAGVPVNSNTVTVSFTNFTLVTATLPAANATGVLPNSTISLTFSKPVKIAPGGVSISPAVVFTLDPAFDAAAFHTTYVLTPSAALAANTIFTVTVNKDLVTAEDAVGMATNVAFDFTTLRPVQITVQPQSQTVFAGANATLSVTAVGDGPLSYDWRLNGESLGVASSPSLTLNNVQVSQSGSYSVLVTGPGGGNSELSLSGVLSVTLPSITLTGTSYTQDFDGVSAGLPFGWSVYTGASLSAVGNPVAFNVNPVDWGSFTGSFRNSASATGLLGADVLATQSASTNRAIGIRQTGSFGDPGASINVALNTLGKNIKGLSFKAQILSSQARSTTWSVQVGLGAAPTSWETLAVFNDPGQFGSTDFVFTEADLAKMTHQPFVWLRIVALSNSIGGGNRDTFGIDDFSLTYEDDVAPLAWDANGATLGAGGATPTGLWGTDPFWSDSSLGDAATGAWVAGGKAAFSAGNDATGAFTVSLVGEQEARWVIFEEGDVTLTGGALRLTNGAPRLQVDAPLARIDSEIRGSVGFIKVGAGTLRLGQANTFTGTVTLGGGTLEISDPLALGDGANDVRLGGTLRLLQSMVFGTDRALTGAGTIELINNAELTLNGTVNTFAMELAGAGETVFSGPSNVLGNLTLSGESDTRGLPLTLINLTAESGASVIGNDLSFANSIATVAVEVGASLRLNGPITMTNVAPTDRLIKTGEGTLVLPVANPNLYKLALGVQGAAPVNGGRVQIDNKGALGTSMSFLNYGTLEFLRPMTGDDALVNGFSFSGREGSASEMTGEDIVVSGTNNIYGAVGTTGSVVVLKASNHTTFNGSFIVDPTTVIPVNTLKVGGSGLVTIASPSFPMALILADTVKLEFDSEGIASDSSAATGLLVESGATLHPGTEGGARRVAVSKNVIVQSGGKVVFDINGSAAGQFDALNLVSTNAALTVDGTLEVRFGTGYTPQAGHQFQILQFQTGVTVDLADVTLSLPALDAPLSWNTDLFATTGLLFIDGPGAGLAPIITAQPQSILDAFASDFVAFAVTAVGEAPLSYQWLYYGQPVSNATNSSLSFNASLANAGVYSVRVSNSHGSVVSAPALLAVNGLPLITQQPQKVIAAEGVTASFTFGSFGTVTGIQWQFNSGSGFANLVGENGATLNRTAGPMTYGSYRVVLTNDNGTAASFAASLEAPYTGPPTSRPEWDYNGDLPPGQVGVVYAFTPGIKPDEPLNSIYRSADRFTATGLPTGLTIHPTTGEISGTPVAIKATPYVVRITARNVTGSAVLSTRILINPLPTGGLGVFTGPIQRSAILDGIVSGNNGALGGQFDMTVAATSVVSGKVTLGARAFSFRGVRATIPTAPLNRLSVTATLRVNATVNLTVNLLVDTLSGTILDTSTISDGTTTVAFKGWRNPWGTRAPAVQATALAGLYTTKLNLVDTALNSSQAPVGAGYLSFTVAPTTGRLTLSGRLSDGSAITMATFAGPAGQILLFRPLYGATVRGSVLGELGIVAESNPLDNTVEGDVSWTRPANAAASNRLYKTGFPAPGMLAVKVEGARYVPPTPRTARNLQAEPRVMGLTDAANEIEVILSGAGIATAEPLQPNSKANVALNNRVTFSLDPLVNTRKMTLAFNAARGTFTGKVTLKQNNPLLEMAVPPLLVSVTRTVTYQGLIVKGEGAGYFILAQLPMIAGDTPTKTAMESGKVEIKAVPVVP